MVRGVWDTLHLQLQCCGTLGPADWEEMDQSVPESCPADVVLGCVTTMSSWLSSNSLVLVLLCAGLLGLQVLAVCLACCLARSVQVGHLQI